MRSKKIRWPLDPTKSEPLNGIAKARQFALLVMYLYEQKGVTFAPFESFENEQDFYAQVADGEKFRIPRGKSQLLLNAMGLKDAGQLRHYRDLLRIPTDFWLYADAQNLTEGEIRNAKETGYTVTGVTVSSSKSEKLPRSQQDFAPGTKPYFSHLTRTLIKAERGNQSAKDQARHMIDETRRWLDEWERRL